MAFVFSGLDKDSDLAVQSPMSAINYWKADGKYWKFGLAVKPDFYVAKPWKKEQVGCKPALNQRPKCTCLQFFWPVRLPSEVFNLGIF